MKQHRAFSIIELLVAISIIALLIAVLLPSLAGARNRARYIKWAAYSKNMQIEQDLLAYYNYEQQEVGDTVLNNRANYDVNYAARADFEPIDLNAEITGCEWTDGRWKGKLSLQHDGTVSDYLQTQFSPATQEVNKKVSVFAWAHVDTYTGTWNNIIQYPYNCGTHVAPWFEWGLYIHNTAGIHTRIDGVWYGIEGTTATPGAWHHLVMTFSPNQGTNQGTVNYYVDGKPLPPVIAAASQVPVNYQNECGLWIGRNSSNLERFNGRIDELGVYTDVISPIRVNEMYRVGAARKRD